MSSVIGVDATTKIQRKLVDANIGFMCMDIVNPLCGTKAWGKFNNRPIRDAGVLELTKQFHTMGALKCQADKVLFVPMKRSWFKNATIPVINGQYINDVPRLELTEEGKKAIAAGKVQPLNGNHRRRALEQYCADLAAQLLKLVEEAEGLETDAAAGKLREIKLMEERIEWAPYWTIQVHDIGACS